MADRDLRAVGKVLLAKSGDEMISLAKRYGLLTADGRIDLANRAVRFEHANLDLAIFAFAATDFLNSRFTNCSAEGVDFSGCRFVDAYITNQGTTKTSFRGARFDNAFIGGTSFGPRTLDMSGCSFAGANLNDVHFRMGKLAGVSFRGAALTDVTFRSAQLEGADFTQATLCRVSFEKAELQGVDFSGATGIDMDFWGHEDLFPPSFGSAN